MSGTLVGMEIPKILHDIAPTIGSVWEWEPLKPHARETVTVTAVTWNGEECWVETEGAGGKRHWNDLSRWVEATVLIAPHGYDGKGGDDG
jgi:hypothetical protein